MEIYTDVGGRPGLDCGGFCQFCFYKNVDFNRLKSLKIGCADCPPHQIGCEKCQALINRVENDFKPLPRVFMDLENKLMQNSWDALNRNLKVVIGAGADIFYYPHLKELVSVIKASYLPLHLGYTSGKAIKDESFARELISLGLDELSFSVFSTDPELRRKWMRDRNPEEAVKSLKLFCENIEVNASVVVIPGVNDGKRLFQTGSDLEEWGVKTFVLRRFANFKNQGLILNDDRPILEGIKPHTYEEFQELVREVSDEFSFRVLAFPFYDPEKDFPFVILKEKNRGFLEELPPVKREATVVTSKLSSPFLKRFFELVDESDLVNVIGVDKEIADLITHEDLESIDLAEVRKNVVLPSGALVHDEQAQEIFSKDGVRRRIKRGPYVLTHPYYESVDFNTEELIEHELKSFKALIDKVNLPI
ncbi:MAG: Radical SAM superfamily protein [Methanobacterium sp. PtaU1.Bin097]|jgi:methanogenesis marker radical SAM protein|nr:MAG: Radical SAM superfamily protein [Methanobacterium sp. PtaU1.Bin097]